MKYKKKALTADCIQFIDYACGKTNIKGIELFCDSIGINVEAQHRDTPWLILRKENELLKGLALNDWLVIQENGEIRTYSDEKFKLLYEEFE